ncbi:hypothetical protein H6P81_021692 [Aristolochia fimbriata]|uniref:Uncharacterized protein n=1 Tax=Aristolochia fimbriata TaxID=158543 RepID=A0AAV7DS31_ARIFI|nr:hypothetical protein H6P81_021692 [Aristolochia fimbriata]
MADPDDPTQGPTSELFNCNNLNMRYWSWNYAAAGTGLALNGSWLRDLDCTHSNYQTREPPFLRAPSRNRTLILRHPSIPWINQVASSRDQRRLIAARSRVAPQHRAGASAVEQKLRRQTSFAKSTKSIGTARIHMGP